MNNGQLINNEQLIIKNGPRITFVSIDQLISHFFFNVW